MKKFRIIKKYASIFGIRQLILLAIFLIAGTNLLMGASGGEIITLNLGAPTNPSSFSVDATKGQWTETYSNNYPYIQFDLFKLTHNIGGTAGTDVGGGMSYWDGFTYCTSGDQTDYGATGSSAGWVAEQWGCMAGGGIKTDSNGNVLRDANGKVTVQQGIPYLVAYWGYYMELFNSGDPCLRVQFNDEKSYEAVGVYICNHPWPYYGNIHGDGFARPFAEGDYFRLRIHGFNDQMEDIGTTVVHTLAEYKNGKLIQSENWEWVDLSALGKVNGIYFTMETTDYDPKYGPNTAVYFCMDKLQVRSSETASKPERPSSLKGEPTETAISFSWVNTSNVGLVTGYNVYLDDVLKAQTADTKYVFTGLSPYTNYKLSVEAFNQNNIVSDRASVNVATTDETAPTLPANLTGNPTTNSIALTWEPSTDNVGIAEYNIYLNGIRKKKLTETQYTLTGLASGTSYTVEVEATDVAGNKSGKASVVVVTTDETAPTTPSDFSAQPSETSVALTWTASTDNIGVSGYNIYVNGVLQGFTNSTSYTVSGLSASTLYTLGIEASDANGNKSDKVLIAATTTDETAPTPPGNLQSRVSETLVALSWTASTDNVGVTGYNIYLNDVLVNTTTSTNVIITELEAVTFYTLSVEAVDDAGNKSVKTIVTVSTTDETAPTQPINLNAVPSLTAIELSWSASVDNVGVEKYQIYLNENLYSATETTSITVTGLTASTNYLFSVEAIDKAGNKSAKSTIQTATLTITGIGQSNMTDIKAYPNPFTDYIILNLPFNEKVSIYNSAGQCKFKIALESGNNRIDVSTLPSGIYLVQIGEKTIKMTK